MLNSRILILAFITVLLIEQTSSTEDPDYILGIKYFQAGQFEPAMEKFQRVVQIDPDHLDARYTLGKIAFLQERYVDAFEFLRDCLNLDPEYKDTRALHQQTLDRIHARFSGSRSNPRITSALTAYYFQKGNLKEAKNTIEFLVKKHPDYPYGWDHLAKYYARLKNLDKALLAAKKALALAPSSPTIFRTYEEAYFLKFHKKIPPTLTRDSGSEKEPDEVQNLLDQEILKIGSEQASSGNLEGAKNLALTPIEEEANTSIFEKILKTETASLPPPKPKEEKPKPREQESVYVPPPKPTRDLDAERQVLIDRAQKAFENKNWELAASIYAILNVNNPSIKEFETAFERAKSYDQFERDFKNALRALKRGAREPAQLDKAKELLMQLNTVTYSEVYGKQSFDEYYAFIAFSKNAFEDTEKICRSWIMQEPDSFQAHFLLLRALDSQGKYSEAYDVIQKCSAIDSETLDSRPGIWSIKVKVHLYRFWWVLALFILSWFTLTLGYTTYKFSVRKKKQRWKSRFDKVRELSADRDWRRMIRAIDELLLVDLTTSERYNLMYLKANGLLQSSELDEARKLCEGILANFPKDQQVMVLLGKTFLALKETAPETLEAYQILTVKEPANTDALKIYLKALKSAGIYEEETEKVALKILDIESYEQEILKDLVEIYGHRQTRNHQSCEVLKRYLELHPDDTGVLLLYLKNLVAVGNYIEAIKIGQRLIPLNPEIEEAHQALIRAYDQLNMTEELRTYYQDLNLEMPQSRVIEKMYTLIQSSAGSARTRNPEVMAGRDQEITRVALEEGRKLLNNGSYHEALLKLQTASQEPHLHFEAKILMMRCYLYLKDMDAVMLNYQGLNVKDQRLNADALYVVYEISQHYEELKETKKALQLLQLIARNDVTYKDTFQKIELLSLELNGTPNE